MDERLSALKALEAESMQEQSSPAGDTLEGSTIPSILISLLLVLVVGIVDYFSGYHISWSIFYLVAISFAAWNVGLLCALLVSGLSIASWLVGDWAAGVVYPNRFVPIWNALITLCSYLIVIGLLLRLKSFHQTLEGRIRQRTSALRQEIATRKQLEKEVAEVTERQSRRIGHELHDSLGQHLTATSIALQVLGGKLEKESSPRSKDVDQAVELVEQGIDLTRKIAKGLFPLELEGEGLAAALAELSRVMARNHHVDCEFKCESPVGLADSTIATHLYRIAQEAVSNAVKHGHVSRILIELSRMDSNLTLTVKDDGIGLPTPLPKNRGIGLRVMSSRAAMIGGALSVGNEVGGGVVVTCNLPLPNHGSMIG